MTTHIPEHKEEAGDFVGPQDLVKEHSKYGQAQTFLFLVCFFIYQHYFSLISHYILKIHQGPSRGTPL